MPRRRLGVVLLLTPSVEAEVQGLRRAVGDPMLERVPPHITLVPPVNVREDDLGRALAVLRAAAEAVPEPLELTLGPAATFAPASPTLFLRVGGDLARLRALRDAVFVPPLQRRLDHPFVPHLTLAQEAHEDRLTAGVSALAGYVTTTVVERVHVLEEEPGAGSGGSRRWTPLADAPLGPPAVVGRGTLEVSLAEHDTVDPLVTDLITGAAAGEGAEDGGPLGALPASGPLGPGRRAIVARRADVVVGAAVLDLRRAPRGGEARLEGLMVAAGSRGEGVGGHVLARAVLMARRAGARRMVAEAGPLDGWLAAHGWRDPEAPAGLSGPWRPI